MRIAFAFVVVSLLLASRIASADVTVYLDRHGEVTRSHEIPRFGGGDRVWDEVVSCVKTEYEPFRVAIVDERPADGDYITTIVGGLPSAMGLGESTDGDSPYTGKVMRNAVDHVFSQAGKGEHDAASLCAAIAHEVGHSLGLDHEVACHDLMSYSDRCADRHFTDVDVSCGEKKARACDNGDDSQNSYRLLARLVGLREDADPSDQTDSPEPVRTARRGHVDRHRARGHHRRRHRRDDDD